MPSNPTAADFADILAQADAYDPSATKITISAGLADWLLTHQVSLAFTSYQTGQLILAGVGPDRRVAFSEQNYARATGLCYDKGRLFVASMFQIWRLENMLRPGEFANNAHDMVLVPRAAETVNYVDTHELGIGPDSQPIFVNSRYSCLATTDPRFSFRPLWCPPFISALRPEDRCHLNGLAMNEGAPAYVTAFSTTDHKDGWRARPGSGGVVIDVASGGIVSDQLSMPHSPRVHEGALWALDSGRGRLVRIDRANGALDTVAFCPGFLRGLAFHDGYAIITASRARGGTFGTLPLQTEIERSGAPSACGVFIIDLASDRIVESIRFEGKISELFDVVTLPGVRNPISLGPATVEMIGTVSFDAAP